MDEAEIVEEAANSKPRFEVKFRESGYVLDFSDEASDEERPREEYVLGRIEDRDGDPWLVKITQGVSFVTATFSESNDNIMSLKADLELAQSLGDSIWILEFSLEEYEG